MLRWPLDTKKYARDARSQPFRVGLDDGLYVYVQDKSGLIFVLPDGPHRHPKVLGNGEPALCAGDLTLLNGSITDFTNLSGTFQFDDPLALLAAADQLEAQGANFRKGAVRYFPMDGAKPQVLR